VVAFDGLFQEFRIVGYGYEEVWYSLFPAQISPIGKEGVLVV
jgi:hypothetical protein